MSASWHQGSVRVGSPDLSRSLPWALTSLLTGGFSWHTSSLQRDSYDSLSSPGFWPHEHSLSLLRYLISLDCPTEKVPFKKSQGYLLFLWGSLMAHGGKNTYHFEAGDFGSAGMPNEALLAPLLPTTPQAFHLETFLGVVRQVPECPKLQGIHSKLLKWVT